MIFSLVLLQMMTEEKIKEIKKLLKKGEPEGELKESLKKEGYSDEEIGQAFKPHHYDMRSWLLIFGVIIFVLGLYIYMTRGGLLILLLSGLLFISYYYESKRLEKFKKNNEKKNS